MSRVLVAGVGNVFLGDDGFGVAVAGRLAEGSVPDGVDVGDFGIAGVHLAYQMLEGYDVTILVDAVARGGRPGDLYVIEPEPSVAGLEAADGLGADGPEGSAAPTPVMDAHGLEPEAVLRLVASLGGRPGRVLVVGCEPGCVDEGMELTPPVAAAVDPAVEVVWRLLDELGSEGRQ